MVFIYFLFFLLFVVYLSKTHYPWDNHDLSMKSNENEVSILMIIFQDLSWRFAAQKPMINWGIY